MKHAIIGDIHGRYDLLLSLMEKLQDTHGLELGKDTFVFLGDYCDRGKQSKEVIEYVSNLKKQYGDTIVLLKGNHEQLAEDYINVVDPKERFDIIKVWMRNGGHDTLTSFGEVGLVDIYLPFIRSLELYYETDDFVCVHGGIPFGKSLETAKENDFLWTRDNSFYRGKIMIVGHTIVKRVLRKWDTLYIDTGAFYSGNLSAVIFPKLNFTASEAVIFPKLTFVTASGASGLSIIPDIDALVFKDRIIKEKANQDAAFLTWLINTIEKENMLTAYY